MATKTKQPSKKAKNTTPLPRQKLAIITLGIITFMLIVLMAVGTYFLYYLWKAQERESNTKITTLILQAIDGLDSPIPIEAQTGKAYMPQVRLTLPQRPSTVGAELEYRYSPAQDDYPEELSIPNIYGFWAARSLMINGQNMEETFAAVPALQSCARGYQLQFKPATDTQNPLIFTKPLADGRTLHVYLDSGCSERNQDFEDYLKQIDSY